jgi:hypothetical protein
MPRIIEVPVRARPGTIAVMAPSHWPLADLRLQTPDLELRWPSLDDLHALADLAAAGIHDPEVQPFMVAWTDTSPWSAPAARCTTTGPGWARGRHRTGCWSSS